LILDSLGRIWSFGYNNCGQLGHSGKDTVNHPKMIPNVQGAVRVLGAGHSSFVKQDHQLLVFGSNEFSELGLENKTSILGPVTHQGWSDKLIIPGGFHNVIVDEEGNLSVFGGKSADLFLQGKPSVKISKNIHQEHDVKTYRVDSIAGTHEEIKDKIFASGHLEEVLHRAEENLPPIDEKTRQSELIHGRLGWRHWKKSWKLLKSHKLHLQESLSSDQVSLTELESHIQLLEIQFSQIAKELSDSKQKATLFREKVDLAQKQLDQCQILDQWISPWHEQLQSLKQPFLQTISSAQFKISSLTTQEVLVFLNLVEVPALIPWFEANNYNGKMLPLVTDYDLENLGIPLNKRLLFFSGVSTLEKGKFGNKKHIRECPVCKIMTNEEQRLFWNEWQLEFSSEMQISPSMLLGFQHCHLRFFPMGEKRAEMWEKILDVKECHNLID
jgi:hypothetical protein